MLQGGLAQQEWRVGNLLHRLDKFLQPFLTHPYQNVRERLGSVLANIYALDLEYPSGPAGKLSPRVKQMTASIVPQLQIMTTEADPELYNSKKMDHVLPDLEQIMDKLPTQLNDVIKTPGPQVLPMMLMSAMPGVRMPPPESMIKPPPGSMIRPPSESAPSGSIVLPADALMGSPGGIVPVPTPRQIQPNSNMQLTPGMRMHPPEIIRMPTAQIPPQLIAELKQKEGLAEGSSSLPNGLSSLNPAWDERQVGVRLLQTMCKLMAGVLLRNFYTVKPELYQFLGMLCTNSASELEPDLAKDCTVCLACLASCILPPNTLSVALDAVQQVAESPSWRARAAVLEFLQVTVFNNMSSVLSQPEQAARVTSVVTNLLKDDRLEVREMASVVLGGLLHCTFIPAQQEEALMEQFKTATRTKLPKKPKSSTDLTAWQTKRSSRVVMRHSGVLGLAAAVAAAPYHIPPHLPDILMLLAEHLHDPQPIPLTIKRVFQNFKRTHQDEWQDHKMKFTDDQIVVLTDLLVSPSYYA
jgi:hypothetical protein